MRRALVVMVSLLGLTSAGCKKQVPKDIVQKSLVNALRHAPNTASAMCGSDVRGLLGARVTNVKSDKDNRGTAHIAGAPLRGKGAPSTCEGDVAFHYSYTSKTTGKLTRVMWSLDELKLVAVQTKGVTFKPVDETPDDGDDDPAN